jgi:hypothetical protein
MLVGNGFDTRLLWLMAEFKILPYLYRSKFYPFNRPVGEGPTLSFKRIKSEACPLEGNPCPPFMY